jgi:hypothetical protein
LKKLQWQCIISVDGMISMHELKRHTISFDLQVRSMSMLYLFLNQVFLYLCNYTLRFHLNRNANNLTNFFDCRFFLQFQVGETLFNNLIIHCRQQENFLSEDFYYYYNLDLILLQLLDWIEEIDDLNLDSIFNLAELVTFFRQYTTNSQQLLPINKQQLLLYDDEDSYLFCEEIFETLFENREIIDIFYLLSQISTLFNSNLKLILSQFKYFNFQQAQVELDIELEKLQIEKPPLKASKAILDKYANIDSLVFIEREFIEYGIYLRQLIEEKKKQKLLEAEREDEEYEEKNMTEEQRANKRDYLAWLVEEKQEIELIQENFFERDLISEDVAPSLRELEENGDLGNFIALEPEESIIENLELYLDEQALLEEEKLIEGTKKKKKITCDKKKS